ncbi:MAG: tetratricopeptide repeat protein [Thermoanaerobaculia bacterium]
MNKLVWSIVVLVVGAGVAAGVCAFWVLGSGNGPWTTRSPAALEEFLAGFEDRSRHYSYDAVAHFERALELDSDFTAAKLYLAMTLPRDYAEPQRWLAELEKADLTTLSERERFLVTLALERHRGDESGAREVLDDYLAAHPEDPFGIREQCEELWQDQKWNVAGTCYGRLLELDPNWAEAQERLGYIAMAQGRFADAEEQFYTYRFIAPEQAAPHHSLAQLLLMLGRYEEADEALDEALSIKQDFCKAYRTRIRLRSLTGRFAEARAVLDELISIPSCRYYEELGIACSLRAWLSYQQGEADQAWEILSGGCLERCQGFDPTAFRIAAMTGRAAAAAEMKAALQTLYQESVALEKPIYAEYYAAIRAHVDGVERMAVGDLAQAAEHFRRSDRQLGYWAAELASFKLFNRLNLLRVLEVLGHEEQAATLRAEIESVNPRVIDEFRIPDLETLKKPPQRSPERTPWGRGAESSG